MQERDVKLLDKVKNDKDLCNYLLCECDVKFGEEGTLNDDLKHLLGSSESNYNMEPFACDCSGGVFVVLNQSLIGYLSSEGQAGIVANNIQDFLSIVLNCGYVGDWAKFDRLVDESTFIKAYNELEIPREKECVKNFIKENGLENEPVKIYKLFKEAISTDSQLKITANSNDFEDFEQLFEV